ncbi:MAG: hypothetical protein PVG55_00865 [Nitrospirota bacterium]
MALELSDEERTLLKKVIDNYLSSLRAEIYRTEKHDFKVPMKREEELLKGMIERLG